MKFPLASIEAEGASVTRRLVNTSAMMGDAVDKPAFMHSIMSQVCLPYREPKARHHNHEVGGVTLDIVGGRYRDPETRKIISLGVPFGAKPRLLMLHLCTQAVRRQSPIIPVGNSLTDFMLDLNIAPTGGVNGSIARFKEQLIRLAQARMTFFMSFDKPGGRSDVTLNMAPMISRMETFFPSDPRQRMLWDSEVQLSREFYEGLVDHALPLDPRAFRALAHSARALDFYVWLAHRLPRVRERSGVLLHWSTLRAQFGPDVADLKSFKKDASAALKQVLSVYPKADVRHMDGGIRLFKSDPAIPFKASVSRGAKALASKPEA